ncbi:uncharacterized protein LOC100373765 [Saccoglossus kowalevskii]|uniref:Uncharacterized protein LOC100373765 n=1 Tax=Saccoglossus kowalevskii TaxID=10224 RepID=A0ABM0GM65_SACKO|nr:PREDICTED: uncharacterized protein LOC100373765 [Saccoglossus kowalevskii]
MVTQTEQCVEADDIHSKHPAKQKSRFSRFWRSFSGKKSYSEIGTNNDSAGNPTGDPEADGSAVGQIFFVETDFTPQVKKEGFLRRSFRKSRHKKREPKDPFPDFSSFRAENVPTTEKTTVSGSTVSSNNDRVSTTDIDPKNASKLNIHICTVNADEECIERTSDSVSKEHFDSFSNNEVNKNGDMAPLQLALQMHSEISEDISQSVESSYKFERSVSFKNRDYLETSTTPIYNTNALSKLARKVSFQKGVVIGYTDLNVPDPVEVGENYTPYPDISSRVTHQEVDSFGTANNQPYTVYTLRNTGDNKTSKLGDEIKAPYFNSFDKEENIEKSHKTVTKLNRKVSFNSRSAISSYSDLGVVEEDDEVFMSDGSVQFSDNPQPSSGSEPGSEQNISDILKELEKHKYATGFQIGAKTEGWERWQTNRTNNLQTSHHPGFRWNFESIDNESVMSIGSSSSPSTPSVSNHETRIPHNKKQNPTEDTESDSEDYSSNQKRIHDARFYDHFHLSKTVPMRDNVDMEDPSGEGGQSDPYNTDVVERKTLGDLCYNSNIDRRLHVTSATEMDPYEEPTFHRSATERLSRRISPNKKAIVTKYEELGISTDTLDSTCTLPMSEVMHSEARLGEFGRETPKRKSKIKKIFGKKNSKGSPRGERF